MPTGWRIVKSAYATTAFDGEGARLEGGRWNSPGTAAVYTAESEALAVLEVLVHLQGARLLMAYSLIPAHFEASLIEAVAPAALPFDWREYPAPTALQQIGDRWAAERRSVVLQVPSAIVADGLNFVLNPSHPDYSQVAIGTPTPYRFDPRLG